MQQIDTYGSRIDRDKSDNGVDSSVYMELNNKNAQDGNEKEKW